MKLRADFNGLFSQILCLSHHDIAMDSDGHAVELREGTLITAFDEDIDDDGSRDDLIASGTVERAPEWLECHGSRWVLRIDESGVRHQSDIHGVSRSESS
jgi:hypothetical protein